MTPKQKRTALETLGRDRLGELTAQHALPVSDRRSRDLHIDALVGSPRLDWRALLEGLKRDELQVMCDALALDRSGREKALLVGRLLGESERAHTDDTGDASGSMKVSPTALATREKFTNEDTEQFERFIEQAEYIETDQFLEWTIEHPDEEVIIRKLSQAGAKLVTGPRGCGKTTLLLKAFHNLLEDQSKQTLPVYVNFKASLKLEPFYASRANAAFIFQQWLLYKIYDGIYEALEHLKRNELTLSLTRDNVGRVIQQLEIGKSEAFTDDKNALFPATLEQDLSIILKKLHYKRCVLLLDDAAHAFSADQQRDFFEFFRSIKSKLISPKAAIYPGVTVYSPGFHVGHDAEQIDVWLKPDSAEYLTFMRRLLEHRLPDAVWKQIAMKESLLYLICFAAFGIPRAMLNMVRDLYKGGDADTPVSVEFSRASTLQTIKRAYENTMGIFGSLRSKLPMYHKFIDAGRPVFDRCIAVIKNYNKQKPVEQQSVTIAIRKPIETELQKILGFFQYAGLLLPRGEISRGVKGVFELYIIHYSALIDHNALIGSKGLNPALYVTAFTKRHSKEFTRTSSKALLDTDLPENALTLALPPCQSCKTPRIAEAARFCLNCGAPLKSFSVFESLVEHGIEKLELTATRVRAIKTHSSIRVIKDILLDHEHKQLRSVPYIGPYWAKRIYSYAEEYIA
jgi:ABC-type iron transport system FetAB ATPase subunit